MRKVQLDDTKIDPSAKKIVGLLQAANFETYLVGGCVRDVLAGLRPKDFDIATNALPQQVKKQVPGSYIIGKRFRLVLVKRGSTQFEVATFRRNVTPEEMSDEDNPISGDNYFGTAEQDALRRDFTVNGLFYDPREQVMLDYVSGLEDISSRTIRMIGEPVDRLKEDPIRTLRALRLSHKLDFSLDPSLRQAMQSTAQDLRASVLPRRREEWLKIMRLQEPQRAWHELNDLGLLKEVIPSLHEMMNDAQEWEEMSALMRQIDVVDLDFSNPLETFAGFLYCFLRAKFSQKTISPETLDNHERWNLFTKEELGVFKVELAAFYRALELLPFLSEPSAYRKRGAKRRESFLKNDALPLALRLSQIDNCVSQSDFLFWLSEIENLAQVMDR